jgi:hypothetical protein
MLKSSIKLTGSLLIKKFSEDNKLIYETEVPNLVVTTGKQFIASRIISNSSSAMTHMAIGSDATVGALAQTALLNQLARVTFTSTSTSTNTVTFNASFGAGIGTGSIVEAGVFNASSSGTMLCRTTFPVITKGTGETIAITWVVTVG